MDVWIQRFPEKTRENLTENWEMGKNEKNWGEKKRDAVDEKLKTVCVALRVCSFSFFFYLFIYLSF